MKYDIIMETTPHKLITSVNEKLKEGWKPQGGIALILHSTHEYYLQAIIKES